MRVALVFVAACSSGLGIEPSREKPVVRLVECSPALPLIVEGDGRVTTHGRLDGTGRGWSPGGTGPRRAATLSFGMPSTSGMMDAMQIRKTVSARTSDITKCYAERELLDPTITRHSVSWRFAVREDGKVLHSNPVTHVLSSGTTSCISRVFGQLVFPARSGGGTVTVTLPLVFDTIPLPERPRLPTTAKVAWTPFAVGAFAPERASLVARASEHAVRARTEKLEACFKANPSAHGSLRVVLGVEPDGDVAIARAGGLGDAAIEKCIETEVADASVVNPHNAPAEVACDFARGDAEPWRISETDAYGVIATSRTAATFDKSSLTIGALEPEPLPEDKTYLIVADPDTPGSLLSLALAWASKGEAALVALRQAKGSPAYLGIGRVGFDDASTTRPTLVLGRGTVDACLGMLTRRGKLSEAGVLAQKLATRCKAMRCGSLVVGVDDLALARDLLEVTGAARRAGFERVLIGGHVECEKTVDDLEALE